jgi:hypothetical protein
MNKKIFSLLIIAFGLIILPINAFAKAVVKPETYEEKNINVWVLEESGLKLYADSSATTDNEIGVTIPYNGYATMKAQKYTDDGVWAYVKYESNEGWIFAVNNGQGNVAYENNREGLKVASTVDLYDYPSETSKVVGKVTSNDLINVSYTYGDLSITWFYVAVNGTKGWIKGQDSFVQESTKKVVLLNDTYVYDEPDGTKTNTKISKDNVLKLTAIKNTVSNNRTITYGLYNLDEKSVWILISGDNVNYAEEINSDILENETATIMSGDKIYSSANSGANEVGVIDDSTKISEAYKYKDSNGNDSYYIVSSSGNGWVLKEFYDYKEDNDSSDNNSDDKVVENNKSIIWIICSIICISAIVVIILAVKKNKKDIQNKG